MNGAAERITRALGGRWHGHYGLAFCPAHENTRTPALSLTHGKDDRLLAYCHAGCSFKSVAGALRSLGLTDSARVGHTSCPPMAKKREAPDVGSQRRGQQALRCWQAAVSIYRSPAERYLRTRGITCELTDTLRFDPHCWHGPSAGSHPAMLAWIEGSSGPAIHRTYLRADGLAKADIVPNKMMLGPTAGGSVVLSRAPGPLVVAEGIETALSLKSGILPDIGHLCAALSAPGIAGLCLPERPDRLIIATDGERVGREAGDRLAERADAMGWRVSLLPAPSEQDWNDVLTGREASQ